MLTKKTVIRLLVIATAVFFSATAWSADPAYLYIRDITDGCGEEKNWEDHIVIYAFGHNINVPIDSATGETTGAVTHSPVKILKAFDRSSPDLYLAMVQGKVLEEFELTFLRTVDSGREAYFTIELKEARVVNISPSMPTTLLDENEAYRHMETVSFVYSKISWACESKEGAADWSSESK